MNASTTTAVCLAVLGVLGCGGHMHSLIAEDSDRELTGGWFRHEGQEPASMMLEFRGQRFEANGFAISHTQNLAQLRRLYGPGRHYDRIFSGLDRDHYVHSAVPELRAPDGATMRCSVVWRDAVAPAGKCVTAAGEHVGFRLE